MIKLSIEKRVILFVVFLGFITSLIIIGVIIPTIQAIQETKDQTYALRLFLEKRYERASHLKASAKKITEIKTATEHFPEHIFKHGDELRLITMLENTATDAGVDQKITASNMDNLGPFDHELHLTLTITGTYTRVLSYLINLEKGLYFFNVQRLTMTPRTEATAPANLVNLQLDLNLYVE